MKQTEETAMSPIMKQYNELKEKRPEAFLLFRVGDFYEAYDEDAVKAGEILGITVTRKFNSKDKGSDGHALKLAGFPYHALDTYLPKSSVLVCVSLSVTDLTAKSRRNILLTNIRLTR